MHCQGASAAHQRIGHTGYRTGSIDQGGSLTHDTAHTQDHTREDARHSRRQHHPEDGAQPSGTQAVAAFPVAVRHRQQRLLGGAHDERQDHDRQCDDTSHEAVSPVQPAHKGHIAEQTIDNGRDTREGLGGHADHRHHLVAPLGILGEVDRRTDAEGHRNEQGHQHHGNGIDDGRHHRGILGGILPLKQRGLQIGNALDEDVEHQQKQHQDSQGCSSCHQDAQCHCLGMLFIHTEVLLHLSSLLLSSEKLRLISRIKMNSTTPVASRASRCISAA